MAIKYDYGIERTAAFDPTSPLLPKRKKAPTGDPAVALGGVRKALSVIPQPPQITQEQVPLSRAGATVPLDAGRVPAVTAANPVSSRLPRSEPVSGYDTAMQGMRGLRNLDVDYRNTTVRGGPKQAPTYMREVTQNGGRVGAFATTGPLRGVRDLDGRQQFGNITQLDSAYSAEGLAKRPGLRRLIEDADIRAKRTQPRPSEAELAPQFAKLQNDLQIAGIRGGAKLRAAEVRAQAQREQADFEQGNKLLDTLYKVDDPENMDEVAEKNATRRATEQFLERSELPRSAKSVQLTHDVQRITRNLANAADREGSSLGEAGSHIAEIFAPDFAYNIQGLPAQDVGTAQLTLDSVIKALDDPKAKSFKYPNSDGELVDVPIEQGFFSKVFSGKYIEDTDRPVLKNYLRLLKRAAGRRAGQVTAALDEEQDEDEEA